MSKPIIVEEIFNAKSEVVWSAITELNQMVLWFFNNIPSFEPKVGFETKFNVSTGERDFMHLWKITEVIQQKKIVYNWKYENYNGVATMIFELSEVGDQTKLSVIALGIENFPQEIPEFTRESCRAGWNYFIKDRLKGYLNTIK